MSLEDSPLSRRQTLLTAADYIDQQGDEEFHALADDLRQMAQEEAEPEPAVEEYFILYRVKWKPFIGGVEDPPMDRDHSLKITDNRVIGYEILEIGDIACIRAEVADDRDF